MIMENVRSHVENIIIKGNTKTKEDVILDKNSFVRPGVRLVGHPDYPIVIGKGAGI